MGSGPVSLGSNRTVTVNANTLTVNGVISDGGNGYSLTVAGSGNLTLGLRTRIPATLLSTAARSS